MWRSRVSEGLVIGAFQGFNCFLLIDSSKRDGFKRVLEAGGALVSIPKSMNTLKIPKETTHVFVDGDANKRLILMNEIDNPLDIQKLTCAFIPEYLYKQDHALIDQFRI